MMYLAYVQKKNFFFSFISIKKSDDSYEKKARFFCATIEENLAQSDIETEIAFQAISIDNLPECYWIYKQSPFEKNHIHLTNLHYSPHFIQRIFFSPPLYEKWKSTQFELRK